MSKLTKDQLNILSAYIRSNGSAALTADGRSSVLATINNAIYHTRSAEVPGFMSFIVGRFLSTLHIRIPECVFWHHSGFADCLLNAAASTRTKEIEKLNTLVDWVWTVLPLVQDVADKAGFGAEWKTMRYAKTIDSAYDALDGVKKTIHKYNEIADVSSRKVNDSCRSAGLVFDAVYRSAANLQHVYLSNLSTHLHDVKTINDNLTDDFLSKLQQLKDGADTLYATHEPIRVAKMAEACLNDLIFGVHWRQHANKYRFTQDDMFVVVWAVVGVIRSMAAMETESLTYAESLRKIEFVEIINNMSSINDT